MTFVLLLSSINVTYAAHFCGEKVVKKSFMLGQHSLSCGVMDEVTDCDKEDHENLLIKKKKCCETKYGSLNIEDNYKSKAQIVSPDLIFINDYDHFSIDKFEQTHFTISEYLSHLPPLIHKNYLVFIQVFRI